MLSHWEVRKSNLLASMFMAVTLNESKAEYVDLDADDVYCISGTAPLKNKVGLKDQDLLDVEC